jgi:ribosomal protein L40E
MMDEHEAEEAESARRRCVSCGATLSPDARFCEGCGDWIGAADAITDLYPVASLPDAESSSGTLARVPLTRIRRMVLAFALLLCFALLVLALSAAR